MSECLIVSSVCVLVWSHFVWYEVQVTVRHLTEGESIRYDRLDDN